MIIQVIKKQKCSMVFCAYSWFRAQGSFFMVLKGTYVVPRIEPRSTMYKASTIPTVVVFQSPIKILVSKKKILVSAK